VRPIPNATAVSAEVAAGWAVAAFGTVRAPHDAIPGLRQTLALPGQAPFPPAFLKHADEQTVVGLAAVFQAIQRHGWADHDFTDWGVLAAPRLLGRACMALAVQRFAQEGAWGVSPHLIPHRSLHSTSGTVSQALGIHGPNFGVGGGPLAAAEVMLAAAALMAGGRLPGLWLVLTGWDPEPILEHPALDAVAGPRPAQTCYGAVALALTDPAPGWDGPRLHVKAGNRGSSHGSNGSNGTPSGDWPWFSAETLRAVLADGNKSRAAWRLGCGGWVKLEGLGGAETNL
jgi:hypothetical protein